MHLCPERCPHVALPLLDRITPRERCRGADLRTKPSQVAARGVPQVIPVGHSASLALAAVKMSSRFARASFEAKDTA